MAAFLKQVFGSEEEAFGFVANGAAVFPLGRYDCKKLYSFLCRITEQKAALSRWRLVRLLSGAHPHVQYEIAKCYLKRKEVRATRDFKRKQHEENQEKWFSGGREAHYRAKYAFGGNHLWFQNGVARTTGMEVHDIESWEVERPRWLDAPSYLGKKFEKCKMCGDLYFCKKDFCELEVLIPDPIYEDQTMMHGPRNIFLLRKLRAFRALLRRGLTLPMIHRKIQEKEGKPQMENERGEELKQIKTGNVILTEQNAASSAIAAKPSSTRWDNLCSSEEATNYDYLTNRFTLHKSFEWKVEHLKGAELTELKMDLPWDFVNSVNSSCNMPIFMPFNIFRYMRSDIEIKFQVNSNKFQVGQLQFSWMYMEKYDFDPPDTMYARSVLPHVLVSAGASNEATLYIPYKHMLPYLHIKQRKEGYAPLYMGTLRVFVTARLAVGNDSGPKSCHVSTFIRFPKCEFVGMKDGSIGEPQMESAAAAMVAMSVVDKVMGDRNCDNPSALTPPRFLVPTGSHSWSQGTGIVEPLHRLNLDGNSKSVGRPAGIDMSETSIGVPCRVFGMLKHFEWTSKDAAKNKVGYLLQSYDAHPQLDKANFRLTDIDYGMNLYTLPPVAVVAGLFKGWRGTLEFRFDVIASQFHTGRLLVAYVPGLYGTLDEKKKPSVTLEQARNCAHAVYSLQDSSSFTFEVPYVAQQPFWPRKYAGPSSDIDFAAPSKVVVFVLNPLVIMESVVDTITIIPYVRAGTDFEVYAPVQPAYGLGRNYTVTLDSRDYIYPTTGSFPYRMTNWQGFSKDKYIFYEGTAAFGTASTFHPPESKREKWETYIGKAIKLDNQPLATWKSLKDPAKSSSARAEYIVLWGSAGGWLGIPFPHGDEGLAAAKELAISLKLGLSKDVCLKLCYDYIADSSTSREDMRFETMRVDVPSERRPKDPKDKIMTMSSSSSVFSMVGESEADERVTEINHLAPMPGLASTGSGGLLYNEKFVDLKDVCRRYQLYSELKMSLTKAFESGSCIYKMPIVLSGLVLDVTEPTSTFNINRDGIIPIVSSGYIFYRGSLRFRVCISSDDIQLHGCKVWIQHVPDGKLPSTLTATRYGALYGADNVQAHGYSTYIQPMSVNSVIEIEIPFYQPGMYGLCIPPSEGCLKMRDLAQYFTLGNLHIGLMTGPLSQQVQIHGQVYYSIGDDLSMSTFRGFPDMVFCDEVWTSDPSHKTTVDEYKGWTVGDPQMMSTIASTIVSSVVGSVASSAILNRSKITAKNIVEMFSAEVAGNVKLKLAPEMNEMYERTMLLKNEIFESLKSASTVALVINALGNMAHVVANPTIKTVAISVVNVLISMIGGFASFMVNLTEAFIKFFRKLWSYFDTRADIHGAEGRPESEDDIKPVVNGVLAILGTALCSILGYTGVFNIKYVDLLRNVSATAGLANNLVRLFQNLSDSIIYIVKKIVTYMYPDMRYKLMLDMELPEVQKWFTECCYLLDARNKDRYTYDKSMLARVFDAATVGAIYVSNGLDDRIPGGKVIWDTYKEVAKLRTDLIERGAHPDVRFEPFPIFVTGKPGIGKSFFVKKMSNDLLKSINYTCPGPLIFDIPAAAKYWTGVQHQAVLVSDDMYQVTGTRLEEEIAMVFQICSSSVLNPPMAAVEDKERRLNPLLYFMFCNQAFPALSPARCPQALYRRRRFLIEADYTEEIYEAHPDVTAAYEIPKEKLKDFNHLRFRLAIKVDDPNTGYGNWMSYSELKDVVSESFKLHYTSERDNFKQRMCDMYSLDPNFQEYNLIYDIPILENIECVRDQVDKMKAYAARKLDEYDMQEAERVDEWSIVKYYRQTFKTYVEYMYANMASKFQMEEVSPVVQESAFNMFLTPLIGKLQEEIKKDFDVALDTENEILLPRCFYMRKTIERVVEYHKGLDSKHTVMHSLGKRALSDSAWKFLPYTALNAFVKKYEHKLPSVLALNFETLVRFDDQENISNFRAPWEEYKSCISFEPFEQICCLIKYGTDPEYYAKFMADSAFEKTYDYPHKETSLFPKLKANIANDGIFEIGLNNCRNRYARNKLEFSHKYIKRILRNIQCSYEDFPYNPDDIDACDSYQDLHEVVYRLMDQMMFDIVNRGSAILTPTIKAKLTAMLSIMYSALTFLEALFPLVDRCTYMQEIFEVRGAMKDIKYCGLRRKYLVPSYIKSSNLLPIHPGCSCCCVLITAMFSMGVNTCFYIHDKYRAEENGPIISNRIQIYDYEGLMKLRREQRKTSFLERCGKYVSHWFFHVLPNWIINLIVIFSKIWRVLLLCWSAYQIFNHFYTPAAPVAADLALDLCIDSNNPLGLGHNAFGSLQAGRNYFKFDQPKVPTKLANVLPLKAVHQSNASSRTVLAKKIERNSVMLYVSFVKDGKRLQKNCKCLMLFGRAMLVLRHYLEEYSALYKECTNMTFDLCYQNGKVPTVTPLHFDELVNSVAWCGTENGLCYSSNFGVVFLPNKVIQFKNIINVFASYDMHNNIGGTVDIYTVGAESSFGMPVKVQREYMIRAGEDSSSVGMTVAYTYQKQASGLCGSVIVSPPLNAGNGAIIGIHVAGNSTTGQGAAEPVYREMFEDLMRNSPRDSREVLSMHLGPIEDADIMLDSNLMLYGTVEDKYKHVESGKSQIIPSRLAGAVYPVLTEVNPLRPNDPRQPPGSHPLRDGCNKHGSGNITDFQPYIVNMAIESISDSFCQNVKPVRSEVKPLTLEQAICGDINVEYFQPLNWKSSEGFPLSSLRPKGAHDKKWLFDLSEGEFGYKLNGIHESLKVQLALRDKCFKENIKPITIYVDCLKDYRLPPNKCRIPGKTRIFSISPIQCTIDVKQQLGDFCASLKKSKIVNGIGIGINPDSFEWTQLVNYLLDNSSMIITLDYSNYGPTLMSQMVAASNVAILNWHKFHGAQQEHLDRIDWCLDNDLLNPVHLCSNLVYQTLNGISSGSPLTGEMNSIPNLFYVMCIYLEIMLKACPKYANTYYFRQFVRLVVYGDDLIMSVSSIVIEWFNACTIQDAFAYHGITVTPAAKDSVMQPYSDIYSATFLKRGFAKHPTRSGIWLAPLDTNSIEEIVNWVHVSHDEDEALLENCRSSLDLAYSQGPTYYKQHYLKILEGLKLLNLSICVKDWYTRDAEIFDENINTELNSLKCNIPWYYRLGELTLSEI